MENNQILQSPNDNSSYKYLTLANGLAVLLVHQADSEKSAAALTVNVGHFDDPVCREGLAHFLEHMLFLGSANYPGAGDYQQFINHHGGSHNAWTGTEHSSFFFDIDTHFYDEALARFADMFSQPLFSSEYVEKERHAIEAEFSLKLKDDGRRIYQVHKETINPEHPFSKFSVGNLLTLADNEQSSLQQALLDFFVQQYSTSRMTLTLVSSLELALQQRLVEQYFSALPAHLPAKTALDVPLYLPEHQAVQLNIQPHRDTQKLVVSFAMPDIQRWYKHKLISFIAHLLGDEGPGSLLSCLKEQDLVNQLSAGGGIDGSNYKDFTIAFELTEKGLNARDDILSTLFSALAALKAQPLPEALFAERQKLLRWAYLYQEPATALQTANHLSVSMQHYPVEDIIFGDYRMELPTEALYQQILSYLTSSNMRLMLIAPGVQTDQQARWYNTPYSVMPLPAELLKQLDMAKPIPQLQLPPPNPYIDGDISLLTDTEHMDSPRCIRETDVLSVWYKADTDFASPKGHIFVQLSLPGSIGDCKQLAATRLWVELFQDNINQQFYAATTIGLMYHLHVQRQGISLHTSGLAANQLRLLQDLLGQMLHQHFSEPRFEELKRQLGRHWRNSTKNKPVARLFSQLSAVLQPLNPEIDLLADALEQLSFEQFIAFHQQLLRQVHIESLLLGNWTNDHALQLEKMLTQWQSQLVSTGPKLTNPAFNIQGHGPVWLNQDVDHNDHALVIYLPAPEATPEQMALFMLANHVLSPEYFHQLRTELQLGYLVGTGYVPINTLPGIAFYIQSPNADCEKLYEATVTFFRSFLADTKALTQEEFIEIKQGVLAQLNERDTSLGARAKRYWLALGQQDYSFALSDRIIDAMRQLTLTKFIEFLQQLLLPDYDAIFLATDGKPKHSHLQFCDAASLKQQLQKTQIAFDTNSKVI
ncbi:insulinase family protein [Rheinheimera baltica]|uniref:insulinase family protein n=1 Tax=Rheinheimera baltica TaxID=67576 RepID=UPI00273F856E|nr:insulinase family protein [Rheinheimera baltica]MDP5141589.1 insulinase family protein [Rheinheimera baltica]